MYIPFIPEALAQLPLPAVVDPVSSAPKVLTFACTVLFKWLFTIAILISIVFVLIAAYRYMTSEGDPGKLQTANKTLIYVAIGIAVAILARSVPVIVGSFIANELTLDPCASETTPAGNTTSST